MLNRVNPETEGNPSCSVCGAIMMPTAENSAMGPWVCLSCGSNEPGPRMYYIQDTRTYVGNSVMWWRKNGEGYTTNLEEAWKVPGTWKGRDTDKLWPCDEIDKRATLQFDMQLLREIKE